VQETVTTSNPGVFGSIARFTGESTIANSVISQSTEGKIGIGTTAPAEKLHLSGPESRLRLQSTNSNIWTVTEYVTDNRVWHTGVGGSNVPNDVKGKYYIYDETAQQFRMVINSSGNVGIGTTSPGVRLSVVAQPGGFAAVHGSNDYQNGLYGTTTSGNGVYGKSTDGKGVYGEGVNSIGVYGYSRRSNGVVGQSSGSGAGVSAYSSTGVSLKLDGSSSLRNLVEGYRYNTGPVFHITPFGAYVTGSDFAEALPARGGKAKYEPGDVLVLSSALAGAVEKSARPFDTRVVGIYSTRPGVIGAEKGGTSRIDPDDLPVAIVGIVPTKVSAEQGSIRVGDLLTTSSTPGYAMRCKDRQKCVGAIVGKALEPLKEGKGVIKVLVMLR
jgi:hypothetical protein